MYVLCFFFQAEDGIRDYKVTGVQTCALPICLDRRRIDEAVDRSRDGGPVVWRELDSQQSEPRGDVLVLPLVERAVGALDVVTARPHQGGERVHPGAGDAGEVISHRDPPLSRLAELRRSACLLGFFFSEARF